VSDTAPRPIVEVWIDVVCPWAYLGLDRTALLRELGFEVRTRAFELNPGIPSEGIDVRDGGRLAATHERIRRECAEVQMPFDPPRLVPNSRMALEWVEAAAVLAPERHRAVVETLFRGRFADGADLGDPSVVAGLVADAGVDAAAVGRGVDDGVGAAGMLASRDVASEIGIAATPAWRFENGFVLPGVHPREHVSRWGRRLLERSVAASEQGGADR
jgi:predicted DsbA family dithiol-disulfide isomerase